MLIFFYSFTKDPIKSRVTCAMTDFYIYERGGSEEKKLTSSKLTNEKST